MYILAVMADSNEKKALDFLAQADKKVKSSQGFLGGLFGGSAKIEEAADLYVRAGNSFKVCKKWKAAGDAFCQAANIQLQLQSKHEAATRYVDAGTCYKKSDAREAIDTINKAISIFLDMGRFSIAAKHHITIAEIYESELVDIEEAINHYQQAADFYKGEESTSAANKALLKVAHYCAQMENYEKAIKIYEEIGAGCVDNALLRYGAKEHFFKAALCHMCIDLLNAQQAVARYKDMCASFGDSRECKLLEKLMAACEDQEIEEFTKAVNDYDSITRLDPWQTTILLRIKKTISEEPDLT